MTSTSLISPVAAATQGRIDAPHPSTAAMLRITVEHRATTTPFASRIGALRPGMEADLLLLD